MKIEEKILLLNSSLIFRSSGHTVKKRSVSSFHMGWIMVALLLLVQQWQFYIIQQPLSIPKLRLQVWKHMVGGKPKLVGISYLITFLFNHHPLVKMLSMFHRNINYNLAWSRQLNAGGINRTLKSAVQRLKDPSPRTFPYGLASLWARSVPIGLSGSCTACFGATPRN